MNDFTQRPLTAADASAFVALTDATATGFVVGEKYVWVNREFGV